MAFMAFLGEYIAPTGGVVFSVNATSRTLLAQSYYHASATSAESLAVYMTSLSNSLTGLSLLEWTFDYVTGKYTVANPGGTSAAYVIPSSLYPWLGASSGTFTIASGGSTTMPRQVRGAWYPGKKPLSYPALATMPGAPEGNVVTEENEDGSTTTTAYEEWVNQRYEFDGLPSRKIWPTSGYENQDAQSFRQYVLRLGRRVRVIENPSDSTTPLATYFVRPTSTRALNAERVAQVDNQWRWSLDLRAQV